jgi:8-oxo-dGTP diphosphatase
MMESQNPPPSSASQARPSIPVLAAVIQRAGRFLVCQRPSHKRHGGLWEFPGGKVEANESFEQAAHRELAEELAVGVESVGDPLLSIDDDGSPYTIVFVSVGIVGDPRPLEHVDMRWLTPTELLDLPLAPSDRQFAEWLLRGQYTIVS